MVLVVDGKRDNFNVPTIRTIDFNLARDYCNVLIELYEKSDKKYQGTVGTGQVEKNIKNSIDLQLQGDDWDPIKEYLTTKLFDACDGWMKEHHTMINLTFPNGHIEFSGYQIQKTLPGPIGYRWHSDEAYHHSKNEADVVVPMRRYITYLWYLNDNDGYTEFRDMKVYPEAGKLLLFFADPSIIHRGIPPTKGEKYIMTGWISTEMVLRPYN